MSQWVAERETGRDTHTDRDRKRERARHRDTQIDTDNRQTTTDRDEAALLTIEVFPFAHTGEAGAYWRVEQVAPLFHWESNGGACAVQ
jgi:hypothetical protein